MPKYRGVVKNNMVVLIEPVELPDGLEVEVSYVAPRPANFDQLDEEAQEDAFEQYLLDIGVISSIPSRELDPQDLDYTPIVVGGKPLSETIIEERR